MTTPQPGTFAHITRHCFVNAPYNRLQEDLLDLFLAHDLNPEIGLEGNWLWDVDTSDFKKTAARIKERRLSCTLHAPFFDLAPGAFDKNILKVSRKKLQIASDLIPIFKPKSIVCHLGYEANKYQGKFELWLENSLATWQPFIEFAASHNTPVMFENTYETEPLVHKIVLQKLNSPFAKFCFDAGHSLSFAKSSWQPWLKELGPWLGQLHLHDNTGESDDHVAIGQGNFPFQEFFNFLKQKHYSPLITLEPHSEEDLWSSLQAIDEMNLFKDISATT